VESKRLCRLFGRNEEFGEESHRWVLLDFGILENKLIFLSLELSNCQE